MPLTGNCSQLFIIVTIRSQEIAFFNDQQQSILKLLLLSGSNQLGHDDRDTTATLKVTQKFNTHLIHSGTVSLRLTENDTVGISYMGLELFRFSNI